MHHHHRHYHRSFRATGNYYKPYKKDPKLKKALKKAGPILIGVGGFLLISGIIGIVIVLNLGDWINYLGVLIGIANVCFDLGFVPLLIGLIFTVMGYSKEEIYSTMDGYDEEIPVTVTVGSSAIICTNCGAANSGDSSFCKKCGKPLNVSATCPHCSAKVDSNSKYCFKCGRPISDNGATAKASDNNHKEERVGDAQADLQGKDVSDDDIKAYYKQASEAYMKGEYAEAFKLFKILAELGDASGQNGLGACYNNGQGVPQDNNEAFKWFRKAADQGFGKAYYNLGLQYAKGEGVQQNKFEAIRLLKKAEALGVFEAREALRILGYNGQDEAFDNLSNALDNMHQALSQLKEIESAPVPKEEIQPQPTEQIDAEEQYDLGYRYFNGIGVEMNRDEAFKCYMRAAQQGHKRAMYKVGDCYYFGHGVERNAIEATCWYRKANEAK